VLLPEDADWLLGTPMIERRDRGLRRDGRWDCME
jgi:hypothetical protein